MVLGQSGGQHVGFERGRRNRRARQHAEDVDDTVDTATVRSDAMPGGKESGELAMVPPWPLRIIQLTAAFLYANAFLWKISGEQWMSERRRAHMTGLFVEGRKSPVWIVVCEHPERGRRLDVA